MDYFNSLIPVDISLEILARLPTESVLDSKLVCTRWRNIVSHHPSFSRMQLHHHQHLNRPSSAAAAAQDSYCKLGFLALTYNNDNRPKFHYFEYNEEESTTPIQRIRRLNMASPFRSLIFVGSHNGLICLLEGNLPNICICNPITRECVVLPIIYRDCHGNYYSWYCTTGFGYVSSTNEYKVLVLFVYETKVEEVYIYTLGSGCGWRSLGIFDFEFDASKWNEPGIFANGALYWMMNDKFKMIITFDLAEEKFREHLLPPPLPTDNFWLRNRIGVLDGFLFFAITISLDDEGDDEFDEIWLLKNKDHSHAMKEQNHCWSFGWTKEFRVPRCEYLVITNRDGVLIDDVYSLTIYNSKTSTSKNLVKFRDWFIKVNPHRNTFISLKELGEEEDIKIMESIETEETKSHEQLQDEDLDPEYIYL